MKLSSTPAWPIREHAPLVAPKPDAVHVSPDGRVRVATIGAAHHVSVDGDNFAGPFRSFDAALAYGSAA